MGLSPLALIDVLAWCQLHQLQLTPWELDTLLQLDAAALNRAAEHQRKQHHQAHS